MTGPQLLDTSDLAGKTLAPNGVADLNDWLLLRFTDGTFVAFIAEEGFDGDEPTLFLTRSLPPAKALHAAAVLSDADYAAAVAHAEDQRRVQRRAQWDALNKEFGTPGNP